MRTVVSLKQKPHAVARRAENDRVPGGSAADDQELESLRSENEKLLAAVKENQSVEARLTEQIEQLRGELCESGEKLGLLYDQMKKDAEEKQLLQEKYATLQEQHADVVTAHSLEIEQLKEQINERCSQADTDQEECCVPEKVTELMLEPGSNVVESAG